MPNAGRKNAPRVRIRDLVTHLKPKLAPFLSRAYDPDTDARSLRVRRDQRHGAKARTHAVHRREGSGCRQASRHQPGRCRYASTNRTRRECVVPLSSDVSSIRLRSQIRDFGGEGVSQSPLKDKVFSTFLDQNPPSELPPKMEFRLRQNCPAQWPVIDNTAIKRLAKGKLPSHRSA